MKLLGAIAKLSNKPPILLCDWTSI